MKKLIFPFLLLFSISALSARLSDGEITDALISVGGLEMRLSRLARQRAIDKEVKRFADKMFEEHAASNEKTLILTRGERIHPKESESNQKLKETIVKKSEGLERLKGKEFDRAYMKEQITIHKDTLNRLDHLFIPNATNPKLKAMLKETRSRLNQHLDHAQSIQSKLK